MTEAEREEKERIKREKIRKFESPIPFVIILRNLIFGKTKPDIYTRITFFMGVILWLMFLLWSAISYFALVSRQWIFNNKGIDVQSIIGRRGKDLGFTATDFVDRLQTVNGIAIICWVFFFIGLVLLYRKKRIFIYFTLVPLLMYLFMNTIYLSFSYFMQDTTMFDKIAILVLVLSMAVHAYLMKNEREGGSISFFGETNSDVDDLNSVE